MRSEHSDRDLDGLQLYQEQISGVTSISSKDSLIFSDTFGEIPPFFP